MIPEKVKVPDVAAVMEKDVVDVVKVGKRSVGELIAKATVAS